MVHSFIVIRAMNFQTATSFKYIVPTGRGYIDHAPNQLKYGFIVYRNWFYEYSYQNNDRTKFDIRYVPPTGSKLLLIRFLTGALPRPGIFNPSGIGV